MTPAPDCVFPDDRVKSIEATLRDLTEMSTKTYTALVGDPALGQRGVIPRLQSAETFMEKHAEDDKLRFDSIDKRVLYCTGILTGVAGVVEFVHWIVK